MKRLFVMGLLCLLVLAAVLPVTSAANPVKLTYVFWGGPEEKEALEGALKSFEAAHPGITVEPMYIPAEQTSEYMTKMKGLLQAGNLPDMGYFREEEVGAWGTSGNLLELDSYIAKDNLRKAYLPGIWMTVKGKTYGAFGAVECQVMFYNKDVLQKAGVPTPPTDYKKAWTWSQFVNYCKKITTDKNGKHPGDAGFDPDQIVRYGVSYGLWWGMLVPPIWSNGGEVVSTDGKNFMMDQAGAADAIQKLADLINKDHVMPYVAPGANNGLPASNVMLANGQLGFLADGQWSLLGLSQMKFPLGVCALPILKKPAQMFLSGATVIFKQTKHPKEAWELQKWMMSPDKVQNLYNIGLWMPTRADWFNNPDNIKKWTDNAAHPQGFKEAVIDSMKVARLAPFAPVKNFGAMWNECIGPELDKVWMGKATAKEAMKAAKEQIKKRNLLQGTWFKF